MSDYLTIVTESNQKVARRIAKAAIPETKGVMDIQELTKLLKCNNNANLLSKDDVYLLASFCYMLGREEGRKAMKAKAKTVR